MGNAQLPIPADASFQARLADSVEIHTRPAIEHVDPVEVELVAVRVAGFGPAFGDLDYLGKHLAARRLRDSEVAIGECRRSPGRHSVSCGCGSWLTPPLCRPAPLPAGGVSRGLADIVSPTDIAPGERLRLIDVESAHAPLWFRHM